MARKNYECAYKIYGAWCFGSYTKAKPMKTLELHFNQKSRFITFKYRLTCSDSVSGMQFEEKISAKNHGQNH